MLSLRLRDPGQPVSARHPARSVFFERRGPMVDERRLCRTRVLKPELSCPRRSPPVSSLRDSLDRDRRSPPHALDDLECSAASRASRYAALQTLDPTSAPAMSRWATGTGGLCRGIRSWDAPSPCQWSSLGPETDPSLPWGLQRAPVPRGAAESPKSTWYMKPPRSSCDLAEPATRGGTWRPRRVVHSQPAIDSLNLEKVFSARACW